MQLIGLSQHGLGLRLDTAKSIQCRLLVFDHDPAHLDEFRLNGRTLVRLPHEVSKIPADREVDPLGQSVVFGVHGLHVWPMLLFINGWNRFQSGPGQDRVRSLHDSLVVVIIVAAVGG